MPKLRHSWTLPTCAIALCLNFLAMIAEAALLDPNAFTSLGTLNVTSGTLTINTDTLAISGAASFTGITFAQGGTFNPEIAVFTFDGIDLESGVTINVTGSRPLALLSRSDLILDSRINLNGGNSLPLTGPIMQAQTSAGGLGGAGGGGEGGINGCSNGQSGCNAQNGAGPGGGASGFNLAQTTTGGGGGGYGGNGAPTSPMMSPGYFYGDLLLKLEAGSGGGGGGPVVGLSGYGGGGGGGALEIGAVQNVYLGFDYTLPLPLISANGGRGSPQINPLPGYHGGGGAGGGILIHGALVNLAREISVDGGGNSLSASTGGGGGGRIAVVGLASFEVGTVNPFLSAYGGPGIQYGNGGVVALQPHLVTVPDGESLLLNGASTVGYQGSGNDLTVVLPFIENLVIESGGQAAFGTPDALPSDVEVTVEGTGVFDLQGFSDSRSAIFGDGEIHIGMGGLLSLGDEDASSTFEGRITGHGDLRKIGSGLLTLTGNNSYGGTTFVDEGTLILNNPLPTPGGPIEISTAGTVQLSGLVQRSPIGTGAVVAEGTLLIGVLSSSSGFNFDGTLSVGSHIVQLLDADAAHLGTQTNLASGGRLVAWNQAVLGPGRTMSATGGAQVNGPFTNNGLVNGPSSDQPLKFTDDVDGSGNYSGNISFLGTFSPGYSLGPVNLENVTFTPDAALHIEIASTSDFSNLGANNAFLAGDLDVSLLGPFTLTPGQTFEIIDVAGALSGMFAGLPEGGLVGNFGGANLFITYAGGDGNDVTLLAALPGDFDLDTDVDGVDFLKWQRGESPTPFSASDLADWEAYYGVDYALSAATTLVPEPCSLHAVLWAVFCVSVAFRRRICPQ